VVATSDEARVRAELAAAGFEVLTVAGTAITSESTLFAEMARAFGFAEGFGDNFDALADALGDLAERRTARLAVLWVNADQSASADLQAFLSAVLALSGAAEDLARLDEGGGEARQLEVFLLGAGAGFSGP
jgi:RNAse (barnase) inhibitor barstar